MMKYKVHRFEIKMTSDQSKVELIRRRDTSHGSQQPGCTPVYRRDTG